MERVGEREGERASIQLSPQTPTMTKIRLSHIQEPRTQFRSPTKVAGAQHLSHHPCLLKQPDVGVSNGSWELNPVILTWGTSVLTAM